MVFIGNVDKLSPSTRFNMDAYVESQDIGGNFSTIRVIIRAYCGPVGNTSSFYGGPGVQIGSIDGFGDVIFHPGDPFLPSGVPQNALRWADTGTMNIPHNPDGTRPNVTARMRISYGSIDEQYTADFGFPTIPRFPNAPYGLTLRPGSLTAISFGLDYTRSSAAPLDRPDQAEWATDAGFTSIVWTDDGPGGYTNPQGVTGVYLNPSTPYWVRIRSHTAAGWGPWSATYGPVTTLADSAPGIAVSPSVSGTSAALIFSAPTTLPLPSSYQWERRRLGTTSPVATGNSLTTTTTVGSLNPGWDYEWRVSAFNGTRQSPWSAWGIVTQPAPSTSAGSYFDGSTPDGDDAVYSWEGTPNLSTSIATGVTPTGWLTFADGAVDSGGTGVLMRATGGRSRQFGARALFFSDATAAGFRAGLSDDSVGRSTVTLGTYTGTIHVRVDGRSQRLAALIWWMDSAGLPLGTTVGESMIASPGAWTRLTAIGEAPEDTFYASVQVIDVTGDGWSLWHGGDSMMLDDAMISRGAWAIPFFDGSMADSGGFTYSWEGDPDASTSIREGAAIESTIVDPDCAPVPGPPRPPVIASDCIEDVVEWRRFWTMLDAVSVPTWLDAVPILKIRTGTLEERQVRVRFYANPFNYAPQNIAVDSHCSEQILSYIPASTVVTLDGISSTALAQQTGGSPLTINHLIYGTDGAPPEWPVLTCGTPYMLAIDIPADAIPGNLTVDVQMVVRH